jgi:AcrR family transcriptional regulator
MFPERVYRRDVPIASQDRIPERLPRGRHGLPRRFIVHNQRERMLLAVAEAVAEQGYAATTVADIIARARLSRRTFYEHFSDKQECFLAAYDTVVEQLLSAIRKAYDEADTWTQKVHDGLDAFIKYLRVEPAFARM